MARAVERLGALLSPNPVPPTDADDFDHMSHGVWSAENLIPAAVLIALVSRASGEHILLTQRTDHLNDHPGQISFPGGRMEADDATPAHTALREAWEEIGLDASLPRILGYLPDYRTATGFLIHPVVACLQPPFDLQPDAFEVAEVFEAPLAVLFDPSRHRREHIVYKGQRHAYHVIECETEGGISRRIWGATAGMLLSLKRCCA
ncbi:MAG: CoA pyrophosphatase [Zoogloeaceae bacterium]|jgi:8-oxo-dGTP pyrophosphatase MutT (NUDIX family)|nr:CoA pyrophosphatase [Zoogloeaceae bacterium]